MTLCREDADSIEAEMRRLEIAPEVSKRELRLYMQSLMPCGHPVACLLTCDSPPFGCCECNAAAPGAPVDIRMLAVELMNLVYSKGPKPGDFEAILRRALGGEGGGA